MIVNISDIPNPVITPMQLTYNQVLSTFSDEFLFKVKLVLFAFLSVMIFLQWYCKQIEIKQKINEKWKNHIYKDLNVVPIIETDSEMSEANKKLCFVSDVMFIPSVVFPLIFFGQYTGWF